jgi:N-acetyl-1-D-myo-inositol-2-amino-2-deoxy-alpha-D-glucopyranoside deacetylase
MRSRRVVFVHAHPDDEALQTGGTMARYAAEGVHVCLITCTNGEVGEIADVPELGTVDEIRPRLGEIRRAELAEACRRLGEIDLRMLGFHDSGMDGTPENDAAHAFVRQDFGSVVAKVVGVLEEVRPQVLVTYNEFGGYGHPDHIRAHLAGIEAAKRCDVEKIYHTAFPKSLIRMAREMASQFGYHEDDFGSEEDIDRIGTDDEAITTIIDATDYVEHKFAALEAHRTQLGTTGPFLLIPDDVRRMALGPEYYVLVRPQIELDGQKESDLFEGLDV